jgi:hypothetical protein
MPKYSVTIDDFSGGLNTKVNSDHGDLKQSPDLSNVVVDDYGAVGTRNGFDIISSIDTSASVKMLKTFYSETKQQQYQVAVCGDSAYLRGGDTFNKLGDTSGFFYRDNPINNFVYLSQLFLSDGVSTPIKFDGVKTTSWGAPTPDDTIGVAAGADGTGPTGTTRYSYYTVNKMGAHSLMSPISAEITTDGSHNITVSNMGTTWEGLSEIDYKIICRASPDNADLFYEVGEVAPDTATFTDDIDNLDLVSVTPVGYMEPPILACSIIFREQCFGANRFGAHPSRLYYSDITYPEQFLGTNIVEVGQGDGLKIYAIAPLDSGIMISKQDGYGNGALYMIYMPSADTATWITDKLDLGHTSVAHWAQVNYLNYLAFLDNHGMYNISTSSGAVESTPISAAIEPDFKSFSSSISNAVAVTYKNRVWVSVPSGLTQRTNNRLYLYDFVRGQSPTEYGAWTKFDNHNIASFDIHNGQLMAGDYQGNIYMLDTRDNDNGTAIASYYNTMIIKGEKGHEENWKIWRFVYLTIEAVGSWDMTMSFSPDYFSSGTTATIDMFPESTSIYDQALSGTNTFGSGSAEWGQSCWGQVSYGPRTKYKRLKVGLGGLRSKTICFKFKTSEKYFKLVNLKAEYSLRGTR